MKSTLSTLTVTNTSKRSVDSSKKSIESFVKFMRIYERKIEAIEFPSRRQMKAVSNLDFSPKQRPDGGVDVPVPQFTIPNWLVGLSVGTTLFTAPAWLPDALQKHLGVNIINKQEAETYKSEGTRAEKLNRLLKEKQSLSWWDWVTGRAQEIDEQIHFVQTGKTKAYTFSGKGTTPTTPTFSENDPNWQGTLAQKQESGEFKKRLFDIKLNVGLLSKTVDKFEKVYFGETSASASSTFDGAQKASHQDYIPPRDPTGPPVADPQENDYTVSGGDLPSKYVNTPDYGELRSQGHNHQGEDYPIAQGTPISMVVPGKVEQAGFSSGAAGGNVLITHEDGKQTRYLHLSSINVKPGDLVSSGQVIGLTGGEPGTRGAGRSTGPHLHLEYYETTTSGWSDPKPHADKYFRFGGNVRVKPKPKTTKPPSPVAGAQQQSRDEKISRLQTKLDSVKESSVAAENFLTNTKAGSGDKLKIDEVGTILRGRNALQQAEDKFYDPSGNMVSGGIDEYRATINAKMRKLQLEIEELKKQSVASTPTIDPAPSQIQMPPAQYPTYNRSNRGTQNNIIITPISTGATKRPIIISSGNQEQSPPEVPTPSASMSDFATAVLLTQLSGS